MAFNLIHFYLFNWTSMRSNAHWTCQPADAHARQILYEMNFANKKEMDTPRSKCKKDPKKRRMDRDINAARNILYKGICKILGLEVDSNLDRISRKSIKRLAQLFKNFLAKVARMKLRSSSHTNTSFCFKMCLFWFCFFFSMRIKLHNETLRYKYIRY